MYILLHKFTHTMWILEMSFFTVTIFITALIQDTVPLYWRYGVSWVSTCTCRLLCARSGLSAPIMISRVCDGNGLQFRVLGYSCLSNLLFLFLFLIFCRDDHRATRRLVTVKKLCSLKKQLLTLFKPSPVLVAIAVEKGWRFIWWHAVAAFFKNVVVDGPTVWCPRPLW